MTDCPRLYPLRIVSRKWSCLVLRVLRVPLTFSEISRELRFITNRSLASELHNLQAGGLVARAGGAYIITPAGAALLQALEPLAQWSAEHKGMRSCPQGMRCAGCALYAEAVEARPWARQYVPERPAVLV